MLHTVAPGETLWWIAAQNNLTTRAVAAYNGLSPDARVVLGSTLKIPSVAEGAAALAARGVTPATAPSSLPATVPASVTHRGRAGRPRPGRLDGPRGRAAGARRVRRAGG